jgi:hypothetical protein
MQRRVQSAILFCLFSLLALSGCDTTQTKLQSALPAALALPQPLFRETVA